MRDKGKSKRGERRKRTADGKRKETIGGKGREERRRENVRTEGQRRGTNKRRRRKERDRALFAFSASSLQKLSLSSQLREL